MPLPPKLRSGSVNLWAGSTPMFTPILIIACAPIHTPIPCATSAEKLRSRNAAWRPIRNARTTSSANSTITAAAPPHTQPFAAPESDQRVAQLIALAIRIRPRVHEADDTLHPVRRRKYQCAKRQWQRHQQRDKHFEIEAAQPQRA